VVPRNPNWGPHGGQQRLAYAAAGNERALATPRTAKRTSGARSAIALGSRHGSQTQAPTRRADDLGKYAPQRRAQPDYLLPHRFAPQAPVSAT